MDIVARLWSVESGVVGPGILLVPAWTADVQIGPYRSVLRRARIAR
jgi:hypothetical protein